MQKIKYDLERLDQATKNNKLKSITNHIFDHPNYPETPFRQVYYCQPDFEDDMSLLAKFNAIKSSEDLPELKKEIGAYLGYRKRDIRFFNFIQDKPFLIQLTQKSLRPIFVCAGSAYQHQLLKQCGISNPEQYKENLKQTVIEQYMI